tara:strand:+ start:571 stop:762 length:192 start_codon:yes stop_codon:yes gene_type:complete
MDKHKDAEFVLVAVPSSLIDNIDVVRDALVDYAPGYNQKDFEILRSAIEWVESVGELQCLVGK